MNLDERFYYIYSAPNTRNYVDTYPDECRKSSHTTQYNHCTHGPKSDLMKLVVTSSGLSSKPKLLKVQPLVGPCIKCAAYVTNRCKPHETSFHFSPYISVYSTIP